MVMQKKVSRRFATHLVLLMLLVSLVASCATSPNTIALLPDTPLIYKPEVGTSDPFSFAIIGDRTGGTPEEWPVFDRAIEEINLLQPDFAVMIGDMIPGYIDDSDDMNAQWEDFKEHVAPLTVPLFVIPGNHDISNPRMLEWYSDIVGRTYYHFVYRDCLFLMIGPQSHWENGGSYFGREQLDYIHKVLSTNRKAKHTFVFMHQPVWFDNDTEWQEIEADLGDRPYSVFAGHFHHTIYQKRNDKRFLVVSATKGETVRPDNPMPELGRFPHFTNVTVTDGTPHVALIEPGSIWPEDTCPLDFLQNFERAVSIEPVIPEGLGTDIIRPGFDLVLDNAFTVPLSVSWDLTGNAVEDWQPLDMPKTQTYTLAPGEHRIFKYRFAVNRSDVTPVPTFKYTVSYKGRDIRKSETNVPLFPTEVLRYAPDYMVAGPYDAGELPHVMPEDPRKELPKMYIPYAPEQGYVPDALYNDDGIDRPWRPLHVEGPNDEAAGNVASLYGISFNKFAYALSGVYSPVDQTVYARFRIDDYAQLFINGQPFHDRELFRTRGNPTWIEIPLHAGWNTVVVKSATITAGWTFRLLYADPDNQLRFAPYPPE